MIRSLISIFLVEHILIIHRILHFRCPCKPILAIRLVYVITLYICNLANIPLIIVYWNVDSNSNSKKFDFERGIYGFVLNLIKEGFAGIGTGFEI